MLSNFQQLSVFQQIEILHIGPDMEAHNPENIKKVKKKKSFNLIKTFNLKLIFNLISTLNQILTFLTNFHPQYVHWYVHQSNVIRLNIDAYKS